MHQVRPRRVASSLSGSRLFAETSKPLPDFADVDVHERALPDGVLLEHLRAFQTLYREHCEARARAKHRRPTAFSDERRWKRVCELVPLTLPTGHFGRDGQPAVPPGGDALEILLEVQSEQRDGVAQPVSQPAVTSALFRLARVVDDGSDQGVWGGRGLVQAQRVREAPAQVVPGGAVQV